MGQFYDLKINAPVVLLLFYFLINVEQTRSVHAHTYMRKINAHQTHYALEEDDEEVEDKEDDENSQSIADMLMSSDSSTNKLEEIDFEQLTDGKHPRSTFNASKQSKLRYAEAEKINMMKEFNSSKIQQNDVVHGQIQIVEQNNQLISDDSHHLQQQQTLNKNTVLEQGETLDFLHFLRRIQYDHRQCPYNDQDDAVIVRVSVVVSNIRAVSEVTMDYSLEMFFRESWQDRRLIYEKEKFKNKTELILHESYANFLWHPDTFIPNAIASKNPRKQSISHRSLLRLKSDGNVLYSRRLSVVAECPMDLTLFPFDSQVCKLGIESYGYTAEQVRYDWSHGQREALKLHKFRLPDFQIKEAYVTNQVEAYATGNYSRLYICFIFTRSAGFCFLQLIIPSTAVVITSWVSMWMENETSFQDMISIILTILLLTFSYNEMMPRVSYLKALDIWLSVCFIIVFLSLVKLAIIKYMKQRQKINRDTTTADGIIPFFQISSIYDVALEQNQPNFPPQQQSHYEKDNDLNFRQRYHQHLKAINCPTLPPCIQKQLRISRLSKALNGFELKNRVRDVTTNEYNHNTSLINNNNNNNNLLANDYNKDNRTAKLAMSSLSNRIEEIITHEATCKCKRNPSNLLLNPDGLKNYSLPYIAQKIEEQRQLQTQIQTQLLQSQICLQKKREEQEKLQESLNLEPVCNYRNPFRNSLVVIRKNSLLSTKSKIILWLDKYSKLQFSTQFLNRFHWISQMTFFFGFVIFCFFFFLIYPNVRVPISDPACIREDAEWFAAI